jgi:peptidoglycan/xylan/chitin deacetylase (PgdA/CDA1 family)
LTSLQIIGINDLLNENFHKNRAVALTFDDGYSDVFNNAYPVIKEMQVPFAVFITTDFIGQNKYMTADQVKALAHDPLCTIGSHSITHPIMRSLPIDLAKAEIKQSKEFLENFIQRGVNYFAYPYGSIYACSGRDTRLVRNAGYLAAFSTIKAGIHKIQDGNKFFIPRINVNEENYREIVKRITG